MTWERRLILYRNDSLLDWIEQNASNQTSTREAAGSAEAE
jgi:hypothetical protein